MAIIQQSNFDFLLELKENNNREWFTENKKRYETERENLVDFAESLLGKLKTHDNIETVSGKKSLFRIYRDVRFSKDKTPYKTHWSGSFKRATKLLRGGYYFHIEPGKSFIGGGFWGPNPADLKRMRQQIADYEDEFRSIIADKNFVKHFGELRGEQLKTAPKGIDKNHPAIDLLRYKQFIISREFSDKDVLSNQFTNKIVDSFNAMRPMFDFMSEALTTNENGELIV